MQGNTDAPWVVLNGTVLGPSNTVITNQLSPQQLEQWYLQLNTR